MLNRNLIFSDAFLSSLQTCIGDYTDPKLPGLVFQVRTNKDQEHSCHWVIRFQIHNNRIYRQIGEWPKINLEEARDRASLCIKLLKDIFNIKTPYGIPLTLDKSSLTVKSLWLTWIQSETSRGICPTQKSYKDTLARGKNFIFNAIGSLTINEVEPFDIASLLNDVYGTHKESTVNKLKFDLHRFFVWCKVMGYLEKNKPLPTESETLVPLLKHRVFRLKSSPHPALSQKDIARFVKLLTSKEFISKSGVIALLFTLLTASRIGNVIGSLNQESSEPMKWSDLNKDLTLWTIKAENMKSGKYNGDHIVPLSTQTRELLMIQKQLQIQNGIQSEFVFTSKLGNRFDYRKIPNLLKLISKFDIENGGNGFLDENTGKPIHAHGFRSSFKTWGTNHGVDWVLTEIALHHRIDQMKYDRAKAVSRRKKVMQEWADFCFSKVEKKIEN